MTMLWQYTVVTCSPSQINKHQEEQVVYSLILNVRAVTSTAVTNIFHQTHKSVLMSF